MPVITTGDRITDKNLYDIGGKALFLKELEEKLLTGEVDLAIHSLKDVPGILPVGLEIAAVLEREDPRDCLVSYKYKSLNELHEPSASKDNRNFEQQSSENKKLYLGQSDVTLDQKFDIKSFEIGG